MRKIFYTLCFLSFSAIGFSQGIYMKIADAAFKGDSPRENWKDYIHVWASSTGGSNTVVDGKSILKFHDFSVTTMTGVNTPVFNYYMASGAVIPSVSVEYLRTNPNGEEYVAYVVKLFNVQVSSVQSGSSGDCTTCGVGQDAITFSYNKISWESKDGKTLREWTLGKRN